MTAFARSVSAFGGDRRERMERCPEESAVSREYNVSLNNSRVTGMCGA